MVELLFIVCLATAPDRCHQERPAFLGPYPHPLSCMREGQFHAVAWQTDHPGWTVRRWTCAPPEA